MDHYIAIEGVIGVGKTSLAHFLQKEFSGHLLLEVFEENPFLARFYQDRARYAFQTQVFFLLNRYDQQRRIPNIPRPLISDYIFDKDWIFAQQNLSGDELKTYERVYEALAGNIVQPDLVIYLRADTPVLMTRIARRDRPYERNMEMAYIEDLRMAYDRFFTEYSSTALLTIDTNELDIVERDGDRASVINQIRGVLGLGPQQTTLLPGLRGTVIPPASPSTPPLDLETSQRHLGDFQRFHRELDQKKGFDTDLFLNFTRLQEEIGELAHELVNWSQDQASNHALGHEFADVLAYIFKLANYTNIDLESAYIDKMKHNRRRIWTKT